MNSATHKQSRVTLYLKGIGSAYVLLVVNICYSFISIPIVLYYLGKETFGLWSLTVQIGALLQLADAGMGGALVRILIDYKDDKKSSAYRQTLYSVWLALIALGIILFGLVWIGKSKFIILLNITQNSYIDYPYFLLIYCLVFSSGFALRPINLVLAAHQRNDIVNWTSALGLVAGFAVLISCLHLKLGLWSLLYSQIAVIVLSSSVNFIQARRLHYLPVPSLSDFFVWKRLLEVAQYGWQRLIAIAGSTMLSSAPTFLITRYLGLESTAIWTIGTRFQHLMVQITARLPELAFPSLVEMHVRGEGKLLKRRFLEILTITGGCACAFSGVLVACNKDFLALWTSSEVSWDTHLNILVSLYLPIIIFQKIFWYPASISKNLGYAKFASLIEVFFLYLLVIYFSKTSISLEVIAVAIIASGLLTSLPIFVIRSSQALDMQLKDLAHKTLMIFIKLGIPILILGYFIDILIPSTNWLFFIIKSLAIGSAVLVLTITLDDFRRPIVQVIGKIGGLKKLKFKNEDI